MMASASNEIASVATNPIYGEAWAMASLWELSASITRAMFSLS